MKTHKLKTVNPFFDLAWKGFKKFELRFNDRDFKEGDEVWLMEYIAETDIYTGREIRCDINYVLKDYLGVEKGYVIFSFTKKQHKEKTIPPIECHCLNDDEQRENCYATCNYAFIAPI